MTGKDLEEKKKAVKEESREVAWYDFEGQEAAAANTGGTAADGADEVTGAVDLTGEPEASRKIEWYELEGSAADEPEKAHGADTEETGALGTEGALDGVGVQEVVDASEASSVSETFDEGGNAAAPWYDFEGQASAGAKLSHDDFAAAKAEAIDTVEAAVEEEKTAGLTESVCIGERAAVGELAHKTGGDDAFHKDYEADWNDELDDDEDDDEDDDDEDDDDEDDDDEDDEASEEAAEKKLSRSQRAWKEASEWAASLAIAAAIAGIILFFFVPVVISKQSMEPNFHSGDRVFASRRAYTVFGEPKRGDVIVFKSGFFEGGQELNYIKRVIGLPGERISIKEGYVYINGEAIDEPYLESPGISGEMEEIVVGEDRLFVMGDNRRNSKDSRSAELGPIEISNVVGKVVLRFYPFNRMKVI